MERMIGKILRTHGRRVRLLRDAAQEELRGFLEADTGRIDRLMQLHPGPLGLENRRRYVWIGPADRPLREDDELLADGKSYLVRSAQTVYAGEKPAYVWAMCVEKGETEWVQSSSNG